MNSINISNCSITDVPFILHLYEGARTFMKSKNQVFWPYFPESSIREEIQNGCLWCLYFNNEIACIWSTTFSDPIIWEEKNIDPSVYIHKIATNHKFRGNNFVKAIVDWAKGYAKENGKKFIRMDTVGNNLALINHYEKQGFTFLGTVKLKSTEGLPDHYKEGDVCLFEIEL